MTRAYPLALITLATLLFVGCGSDKPAPGPNPTDNSTAHCGPNSRPETGMQGRVSQEDHDNGLAREGFTCNTELVGSYTVPNAIGSVGGFKVERYIDNAGRECAYYDSTLLFPTSVLDMNVGINVLDMSDPEHPMLANRLITPAMLSPHESMVVSQQAGILAAVMGNVLFYPGLVDVYDLSEDCRNPVLRASAPVGRLGHESGISPDGKTFFTSSPASPTLTAIDLSNPEFPSALWYGNYRSHGLSISADGNRAYVAGDGDNGLLILDISEIQARQANPEVREVARLSWANQSVPQNAIPFTRDGRPYVLEIDEFSTSEAGKSSALASHGAFVGAGRIIDISNESEPNVISELRLAVHKPENRDAIANDPGASNIAGGYAGHYCDLPTRVNPDIVACSMILSGLRIFDIRDPHKPREVAYFNAPVTDRPLDVQAPSSNMAMSKPAFAPERKEIWYTDGYSGFYVVRVTNGAW